MSRNDGPAAEPVGLIDDEGEDDCAEDDGPGDGMDIEMESGIDPGVHPPTDTAS